MASELIAVSVRSVPAIGVVAEGGCHGSGRRYWYRFPDEAAVQSRIVSHFDLFETVSVGNVYLHESVNLHRTHKADSGAIGGPVLIPKQEAFAQAYVLTRNAGDLPTLIRLLSYAAEDIGAGRQQTLNHP